MEKAKAHYPLAEIQAEVARRGAAAFTRTALCNGRAMGLMAGQMVDVVRVLGRGDFYKSMTTHADHTVWQDVYHAMTPVGKEAYIKVTGTGAGLPPVIQFKEK
jgi:motility quorum-sensing regulator/GCU-specific mRNA interferase toxin